MNAEDALRQGRPPVNGGHGLACLRPAMAERATTTGPSATPRRIWSIAAIVLAGLGTTLALRTLLHFLRHHQVLWGGYDSWAVMLRALEVLSGPQAGQLYQTLFFEQRAKFQYPPTSLLPLELLGRVMPLDLAYLNGLNLGVFLLNAAALAWLAHAVFSAGTGPLRPGLRASWAAAFAFLAGIIFYPVTKALMQGQIQVWLDLGFTLAVLAWWLRRHFTAGLLLGLACAIKPQLGLFLLWGLVWRRWDFVVGFLAAALPVGALSVAFYGLPNHIAYLEALSFILRHGEAYAPNNSVNGILNRPLLGGPSLPWDEHAFAPYNPYVHAGTILATLGFLLVALAPAVLAHGEGAAPAGIRHRRPLRHHGLADRLGSSLRHHAAALRGDTARIAETEAPLRLQGSGLLLLALSWCLSASLLTRLRAINLPPWNIVQAYVFFGATILLGLMLVLARPGAPPWQSSSP